MGKIVSGSKLCSCSSPLAMPRAQFIAAFCAAACYSAAAGGPNAAKSAHASAAHSPASADAEQRAATSSREAHDAAHANAAAPASPGSERSAPLVSACPPEMALVERASDGSFCVDRWEASLVERKADGASVPWPGNHRFEANVELVAVSVAGRKPQGYISGAEASLACERAGKRLCELDEWVRACRGPHAHTYPYGDRRERDRCNDRYRVLDDHPVVALFDRLAPPGANRNEMWQGTWMNDPRLHEMPRSVEPAGARSGCRSDYGVYDMVGNLHEWIADPDGTFVGGFFMDTFQNGEGCGYRTRAHDFDYHDYSTGFRCCKDASD